MRMPRREFLRRSAAGIMVPYAPAESFLNTQSVSDAAVLENNLLRATFDRTTGALLELTNKTTGRQFQGRRRLARSFLLVAPLPDRLWHVIEGEKQTLTDFRTSTDRLQLTWEGLHSPFVGKLDIRLEGAVTLSDVGLTFEMTVHNGSPYRIESVAWPYIGDLRRPTRGGFR